MAETKKEKWYIVQTYSGKEDTVADNLTSRITSMNMQEKIFRVIVPTQIVLEKKKDGTTKEKVVKTYPGYVFVEMIDDDDSWWVVRNTPQVTGFLGSSGKKARPVPVPEEEMEPILESCGLVKPVEINYKVGDTVTIVSGTWKDRIGVVESIDVKKNEVRVSIEMNSGRSIEVPVEVNEVEII